MTCTQPPGPPPDGADAAERPAEVAAQGIEEPKVPAGPMLREATSGLAIPEAVDELMREHLRFLYKEGGHRLFSLRCADAPAMLHVLSQIFIFEADLLCHMVFFQS